MTEPTPGPWQALPPQGRARLHGIFDADGGCLAECFGQKAAANARLLAAAPEMLDALRSLLADCIEYAAINNLHNSDGTPATHHAMRQAHEAIRKAMEPRAGQS